MHARSQKSFYNSAISDAFPKGRCSISNPTTQADDLFAFSIAVHGRRRELEMELSVCLIYLKEEQEDSEMTTPLHSQRPGCSIPSIMYLAHFYVFNEGSHHIFTAYSPYHEPMFYFNFFCFTNQIK